MLIHEDYFKNIFNTVREAILILDENMRVLSANRSFFHIFKVDTANTIGSLLYDLGNGQWNIPYLRVLLEDILPKNDTVDDYEIEHNFESIGQKTMLLNACKIREKKDDLPMILLAIEDITERKRLEDLLAESEERYRRAFETASDGIVLLDKREGHITHANPATEKMLGYSEEECIGKKLQDIGVSLDMSDFPTIMQVLNKSGILNYADIPIKTKFGQYIDTDIYMVDRARLAQCNIRDVTERKQKEDKILSLGKEWQKTFDAIPASIFLLDLEGRITRCNKATELLLDKTQDEIIGLPCWELMHGTDKPIPECPIPSMMKDRKRKNIVIPAEDRWLQITVDPILDEVGELIGAVHTIDDVTERKKAEKALRGSQQILEGIINAIPVRVFWKDKNLVYLGCNAAFARDAGFADPKDIIGKDDYQMGWRDQAELYRNDDRQVIESGSSKLLIEEPLTTPDGNTITLLTSKVPLRTSNGEISGVLGTYMDITALKCAEQALFSSEKKFKDLLETINLLAVMLDCDGNITFCNDYLLHLTGWTRDELLHRNWFELFFPEDVRKTVYSIFSSEIADGTIPLHYENIIITREGSLKIIVWDNSILRNPDGNIVGVASVGTDVTEHRKLEEQLRHAQKMEAVGTLAGGIAHDFNNILNVIIGYGTMVMDKLEAGSPSKEQMNEVLTAAERAANLTKRLLVFSRKQVVEVKSVNINELILGLQKMLVRIIRENIDFKLDLTDRPLAVMADAGQIEQVLMNLASNARDAMPENGRLTIGTGLQELDDEYVAAYGYGKPGMYALITVSDTGQGIDAETKEKIFEPFFTTKGIGEGTGLGLAISYGIIKQHSGYIKVYSEPGQGTEFKIYLPLIEESAALEKKTETPASVKGGNETILLAEDDASLRKMETTVLESYGYSVITAEDGEDAITKFMENKERISLALIDMIMPKKNGKEVGKTIRKVSPRTKILFASGYTMDIIKTRELTESSFDFILKPILPRDLLKKVREVLDR